MWIVARPKSEERRQAIIDSAVRLIARDGLGAATAAIAKEAGVPNGSVFTYFPTKVDLFNTLYVEIKREVVGTIEVGLDEAGDEREQLLHLWSRWTHWGAANPDKRRVLAQLGVSGEVSPAVKQAAFADAHRGTDLVMLVARHGALRSQGPDVVIAIVESLASTTIDLMGKDPDKADEICVATFELLWKALR